MAKNVMRVLMMSSTLMMAANLAAAEDVVLGYIPASLEYPYNVATAKGFEEQAKELGATALIVDPRGSVERQANAIDDLVSQGVDGVAALTLDGVVGQAWVDRLAESGIPYVSVATQIGDPEKRAWNDVYPGMAALVGMDNVRAGELSGELAAEMLPRDRTAKIAIIEGAPGYPQSRQRSDGFKQGLDKAGIKYEIVSSQPTDWTAEAGEAVCQNVLIATPDVDLFFSQADDMAIGCNRALEAAESGALLIATGGGSSLGLAAIEAGEIDASVCDRPEYQGRLAAKALYDAVTKPDSPKGQLVTFETPKITKATLADCPPEW
ncbi:sugar ABC transporter substrate-binding protein [Paracoccus sp. P2]|uniref:sugar ABC transporter substrate-binding protein n=1 Tax=Paracoccus sp. P2 TaxID=3248840 RepID=UPI00391F13D7